MTKYLNPGDITYKKLTVVAGANGTGKSWLIGESIMSSPMKRFEKEVPIKRCLTGGTSFNEQKDLWMEYIMGKNKPTYLGHGLLVYEIVSLALTEESTLIVQNPERFLHPKVQSKVGYFLAKMAATDLQVIIETHSEHIINGIRIAVLSNIGLKPADVIFNFLELTDDRITVQEIEFDDTGSFIHFPVDFMDQGRQDIWKIINLTMENKKLNDR